MTHKDNWIPLFPLQLVLFPGSKLPLHIFEERYKTLIKKCLETGLEFGINLANGSLINAVGCSATVIEVIKHYENGEMDIIVEGKQRYTLLEQDNSTELYLMGRVKYLPAEPLEASGEIRTRAIELYNEVMDKAYGGKYRLEVSSIQRKFLSFYLAQKAGLPVTERQGILEMNSEQQRINYLVQYFTDVIPKLKNAKEIQRIVQNDGFIPE